MTNPNRRCSSTSLARSSHVKTPLIYHQSTSISMTASRKFISVKQGLKLLLNIQAAKACGPDGIFNLVLKECAHELTPSISRIFQCSLDTGLLPTDWLNANIAPVFKKGDRHAPENYRPVSLTSVLSKILEHIVCHHLLEHFDHHKIMGSDLVIRSTLNLPSPSTTLSPTLTEGPD